MWDMSDSFDCFVPERWGCLAVRANIVCLESMISLLFVAVFKIRALMQSPFGS
uniref:Uncharacterized protein n=1 Tax=Rhizophora mucronata TaxID=61149 RepID=A0A2P2QKC2_RHIMU